MSENHLTFSLIQKYTNKYGEISDQSAMTSAMTRFGDWLKKGKGAYSS